MSSVVKPFDWKHPDYESIWEQRLTFLRRIRAQPEKVPGLRAYYRDNIAQFVSDWGVTHDPRNPERGLPAVIPFVLFSRQVEWIAWALERWQRQEPGITEKSRDTGASWLLVALSCSLCLFREGITIGIGSRKEDLIDRSGDPSSLFYKARAFMDGLPAEFANGWDVRKHSAHMRLSFLATRSALIGEAGDDIGRGARTSIFFVDEAAHIERPALIDASLSATTNCRIDVSSVNGMANSFAVRRHSGKVPVFRMHWRDDPRKDAIWYAKQCETLDPVTVAQEIDIDYKGSSEGQLIPANWVQAAVDAHTKLGITPTGWRRCGLDVADEGKDQNAIAGRHGILLQHLDQWSGKGSDIYGTTVKAFDFCDSHKYEHLLFDSDGLGSGVRGDARIINERREAESRGPITCEPFRGSAAPFDPEAELVQERKNKDFFANCKAMSWWHLRLLFQDTYRAVVQGIPPADPDHLISLDPNLPHLQQLLSELSQPTYSLNSSGKILVDKQPDGARSPNLADAVMICYSPIAMFLQTWLAFGE